MTLLEQLINFLNCQKNKDDYISAEEFKNVFLMGFARQIQINVEQFFDFKLIDSKDGNCQIIARLKQDNETICHILNEFFLKKNFSQVKEMFGVPDNVEITPVGDGIIELE